MDCPCGLCASLTDTAPSRLVRVPCDDGHAFQIQCGRHGWAGHIESDPSDATPLTERW